MLRANVDVVRTHFSLRILFETKRGTLDRTLNNSSARGELNGEKSEEEEEARDNRRDDEEEELKWISHSASSSF